MPEKPSMTPIMKTLRSLIRNNLYLCTLLALACLPTVRAQKLTPVWEYLINKPGSPIPVLTNTVTYTTDSDNGDGKSTMDSLGALLRYDQNRLLLGIRENGI